MAAERRSFSLRIQAPPSTEPKQSSRRQAVLEAEKIIDVAPMTQPKSKRKMSTEEFRKTVAEHGVEQMSEEEREVGVWSLTLVAKKTRGDRTGDTPSDQEA